MARVLVTGGTGFVGSALLPALSAAGFAVRTTGRRQVASEFEHFTIPSLDADSVWRRALEGVQSVVHLAGPAHARMSASEAGIGITAATAALAAQAQAAGVSRFVFVSSIKAAAARTHGAPVSEASAPTPDGAYGSAKRAAEKAILQHAGMQPVILRPPLVFAPDAKANFARLLRLAASGAPLPLASVRNRRSLISRESLIAAIVGSLGAGPAGIFHLADRPALSSAEMLAALRRGLGMAPRLFSAPILAPFVPRVLRESLEIDDSAFRAAYGGGETHAAAALEACAAAWSQRR